MNSYEIRYLAARLDNLAAGIVEVKYWGCKIQIWHAYVPPDNPEMGDWPFAEIDLDSDVSPERQLLTIINKERSRIDRELVKLQAASRDS